MTIPVPEQIYLEYEQDVCSQQAARERGEDGWSHPDRSVWDAERLFVEQLMRWPTSAAPQTWMRDELCDCI